MNRPLELYHNQSHETDGTWVFDFVICVDGEYMEYTGKSVFSGIEYGYTETTPKNQLILKQSFDTVYLRKRYYQQNVLLNTEIYTIT